MTSCVYFKMFHNRQSPDVETISFTGTEIKLLELKRSIVEIKKFSQGMNFDLTILDAENPSRGSDDFDFDVMHLFMNSASACIYVVPTSSLLCTIVDIYTYIYHTLLLYTPCYSNNYSYSLLLVYKALAHSFIHSFFIPSSLVTFCQSTRTTTLLCPRIPQWW
jgi:hypothetical protein